MNDMGWEKLPYATAENDFRSLTRHAVHPRRRDVLEVPDPAPADGMPNDMRWVLALGVRRRRALDRVPGPRRARTWRAARCSWRWPSCACREGRLWNARLLPFYYLGLYLLAAVGVAEVGRTVAVARWPATRAPEHRRPGRAAAGGDCSARLRRSSALPLRSLPGRRARAPTGATAGSCSTTASTTQSFVRSWARWNYTGYEGKAAYAEYRDLVHTMDEIGEEHGCGRSFWEYEKEINRYGTPMALMLLPHWTDGCIGSMEGLFFEASATTPFHFLTQVELERDAERRPARPALRQLRHRRGRRHLQLMGVRYYLATSAQATTAARAHPDLTELATSGPVGDLRGGRQRAGGAARERAGGARRAVDDDQHDWICSHATTTNGKCAGPGVDLVPGPATRRTCSWPPPAPTSGSASTSTTPTPRRARCRRPRCPTSRSTTDRIAFDVDQVGHAGAGQGVVLPELAGRRRRRARTGWRRT